MKKIDSKLFILIILMFFFFLNNTHSTVTSRVKLTQKGKITDINLEKNYIKINNKKYYYKESFESKLERLINKKVILNLRKRGNKLIILNIISGEKNTKHKY